MMGAEVGKLTRGPRDAHPSADPLRAANDAVGAKIAAAMNRATKNWGTISLTYHDPTDRDDGDRPATKPTDEIEITHEMVQAGVEEFWSRLTELSPAPSGDGPAEEACRAIYRRMYEVRNLSLSIPCQMPR